MIDDCISWKYHISYICSQISRDIDIISKLRDYPSVKQLKQIHYNLICPYLYSNPSYSRILIGSRLWSIRGQTHDWRHHYKVFLSTDLKRRKVLRIRIIFYVTGQQIKYKKVFPRHWTGSRSQKTKDKAVSFRKWHRNNFLAASVGSRARLNHAQTWSW